MSDGDSFKLLGNLSNYDVVVSQSGVVTITDVVDIAYDVTPNSIEISIGDLKSLCIHADRLFKLLSNERQR